MTVNLNVAYKQRKQQEGLCLPTRFGLSHKTSQKKLGLDDLEYPQSCHNKLMDYKVLSVVEKHDVYKKQIFSQQREHK